MGHQLTDAATGPGSDTDNVAPGEIDLEAGTIFADRFEILEAVGGGGSAVVYLAFDLLTQRELALKVIHPAVRHDDICRRVFAHEASVLGASSLDHPSIPKLVASGRYNGRAYNAQEYLQGQSLRRWLNMRRERPGLRAVADLFLPVCHGIAHLHRAGLVHRDLKLENVVAGQDRVLVVDYGVTCWKGTKVIDGIVTGTPYSMSPHQWAGRDADPSDDVYALAVMAYMMLALEHPLVGIKAEGSTKEEIERLCLERLMGRPDLVVPLDKIRPDLPPEVVNVIMRGLDPNPGADAVQATDFMRAIGPYASKRVRDQNLYELGKLVLNQPQRKDAPVDRSAANVPSPQEETGLFWWGLGAGICAGTVIGYLLHSALFS